jgi:hypothetical protein
VAILTLSVAMFAEAAGVAMFAVYAYVVIFIPISYLLLKSANCNFNNAFATVINDISLAITWGTSI